MRRMTRPTGATEREPILDALRGVAILGILLVNMEIMRGSEWLALMGGAVRTPVDTAEKVAQFAIGWLASGKFISSLAILFGLGAALISARSLRAGESPRPLLARRYGWLMAYGGGHMLLYPGDILFLYGVTGFGLLLFVTLRTRALFTWAAALFVGFYALSLSYLVAAIHAEPTDTSEPGSFAANAHTVHEQTIEVFSSGSLSDILQVHVSQSFILQNSQLFVLPWVLALFLFGFALGRLGIVKKLGQHRAWLRRVALVGIGAGLPANLALGLGGPLAGYGPIDAQPVWITVAMSFGQLVGAPLLAVGYLSALCLVWLRRPPPRALAAVGRMALSAYILESALALSVFAGLRLYDQLTTASALVVVATIWTVLLVLCPIWLKRYEFGPLEWLWRKLSYGRGAVVR